MSADASGSATRDGTSALVDPPSSHGHGHGHGTTDALLHAIYQAALDPADRLRLQSQLLIHFREDRSADETPWTRIVLGHLRRALRLGQTLSALQAERQQVSDVIDAVAPPIVVIDGQGRILGLNRRAESLLTEGTPFSADDGVLRCAQTALLPRLIAAADREPSVSARLGAGEGSDEWLVCLYRNVCGGPSDVSATYSLLLVDRSLGITRSIDQLGHRFGLTPRETELVGWLVQGLDLAAICTRAEIAMPTLRQHIRNVYAKTGVHNENALFARVLQNTVLEQASRTQDARLLPHINGLARSRVLRLPDGRAVSVAEYGAPHGKPVLYFHALNASRLELLIHDDRLRALGLRLIAMDRPGYGHSTFVERRDYRDYTDDVRVVLDEIGLGPVHLLSASAGCAHALHTAWAMPERVHAVHCTGVVPPIDHILASDSPSTLNGLMNRFFRVVPSLLRPAMELALSGQTVSSLLTMVSTPRQHNTFNLTEADIAYINQPEHLPYFVAAMVESLRQGAGAWAMESTLINRPWTIDLHDIRVPVHLWHGTHDGLVPVDMVSAFARALPDARLTVQQDETHLFVFHNIERLARAMG